MRTSAWLFESMQWRLRYVRQKCGVNNLGSKFANKVSLSLFQVRLIGRVPIWYSCATAKFIRASPSWMITFTVMMMPTRNSTRCATKCKFPEFNDKSLISALSERCLVYSGHGFGLPHTDESFWNRNTGNCLVSGTLYFCCPASRNAVYWLEFWLSVSHRITHEFLVPTNNRTKLIFMPLLKCMAL